MSLEDRLNAKVPFQISTLYDQLDTIFDDSPAANSTDGVGEPYESQSTEELKASYEMLYRGVNLIESYSGSDVRELEYVRDLLVSRGVHPVTREVRYQGEVLDIEFGYVDGPEYNPFD